MQNKDFQVGATFGIQVPANLTVKGYAAPSPFTPALDKAYLFRKELLSYLLAWVAIGGREGLYLTGPTGAGKSSLICQVAARLNIPVQRIACNGQMELAELVGHYTYIGRDVLWLDGPLTVAMRYGHWFLLDELDLLQPAIVAGLNAVLDGAPLVIAENSGEVVAPHPDFRFIATGNTAGGGDITGLYQGTVRQNLAFMDRFWVVEVDYPNQSQEEEILQKAVPYMPAAIRSSLIEIAGKIRNLFSGKDKEGAQIEVTMSTRTLIKWAKMTWFFHSSGNQGIDPTSFALNPALGFRAEPATRQALHEIVQRVLGNEAAIPAAVPEEEVL